MIPIIPKISPDLLPDPPRNGFFVFCDKETFKIRGWCSVVRYTLHRQEMQANEIVVEVYEQPNLAVHFYVNPTTGEMTRLNRLLRSAI